jgi:hypothetical protein
MSEYEIKRPLPQATKDARDLLERLYREIGISAVAAALQLRDTPDIREAPRDLPAVLRGDDFAA